MTVHFKFPWSKKREPDFGPPAPALCNESAQCAEPRQPSKPPHPCLYSGHEYQPLTRIRKHIVVFCPRCIDVQFISLQVPASPKASLRPQRFADLA
jgi:hypothetical protein